MTVYVTQKVAGTTNTAPIKRSYALFVHARKTQSYTILTHIPVRLCDIWTAMRILLLFSTISSKNLEFTVHEIKVL